MKSPSSKSREALATGIIVACALSVVAMQAYQLVGADTGTKSTPATEVAGWDEAREIGIQYGSMSAENSIVYFIDFTCPFCQQLAPVLDSVAERVLGSVEMTFMHFTLDRPLSLPSAQAAECAELQGSFRAMASVLYIQIPGTSPGEVDWQSIATEAGVPSLSEFMECMERPSGDFPRIRASKEFGRERGVAGTPTVWINGFRSEARTVDGFVTSMR